MSEFQWWQIVLGLSAVLVPAAIAILGRGFASWADRLNTFSNVVDQRLEKMSNENAENWREASARLRAQEIELHRIHLCVEKRLVKLETKVHTE